MKSSAKPVKTAKLVSPHRLRWVLRHKRLRFNCHPTVPGRCSITVSYKEHNLGEGSADGRIDIYLHDADVKRLGKHHRARLRVSFDTTNPPAQTVRRFLLR